MPGGSEPAGDDGAGVGARLAAQCRPREARALETRPVGLPARGRWRSRAASPTPMCTRWSPRWPAEHALEVRQVELQIHRAPGDLMTDDRNIEVPAPGATTCPPLTEALATSARAAGAPTCPPLTEALATSATRELSSTRSSSPWGATWTRSSSVPQAAMVLRARQVRAALRAWSSSTPQVPESCANTQSGRQGAPPP